MDIPNPVFEAFSFLLFLFLSVTTASMGLPHPQFTDPWLSHNSNREEATLRTGPPKDFAALLLAPLPDSVSLRRT